MTPTTAQSQSAEPAKDGPPRYLKRALGVFGFASLAGPPIGGLLVMSIMLVPSLLNGTVGQSDSGPNGLLSVALAFSLYAYVLGGIAALCGAALLAAHVWRHGTAGYGASALTAAAGALAQVVAIGLATASPHSPAGKQIYDLAGTVLFLVPLSVASALICRALLGLSGLLPRHSTRTPN